jgi:hypothetical protein
MDNLIRGDEQMIGAGVDYQSRSLIAKGQLFAGQHTLEEPL